VIDRDFIFRQERSDDEIMALLLKGGLTETTAMAELAIFRGEPFEDVIDLDQMDDPYGSGDE
jgi:hypothetical protein